jgi:hypothetical protein
MSLKTKIKVALDETRLLILGAQVLFGFQLHGAFQEAFPDLSLSTRYLASAGQFLMALALGLLIAPSMQHRIVENGEDTVWIHTMTTLFAGMALLPFGISLGLGAYIVFDHLFGMAAALAAGTVLCVSAGAFWYGLGFIVRAKIGTKPMRDDEKPTSLQTKIDQLLTEARLILPGAQALLGFQLTVTLTRAFEQLPISSRLLHVVALCCVALCVILLMTPAALHRIGFAGEDAAAFYRMGSWFVIGAPIPLAIGIAADLYVATAKATDSARLAMASASFIFAILALLWYALPMSLRLRYRRRRS